jgi:hypothetical protein
MTATPKSVSRVDEPGGDTIQLYTKTSGANVQATALDVEAMSGLTQFKRFELALFGTFGGPGWLIRAEFIPDVAVAQDLWLGAYDRSGIPVVAEIPKWATPVIDLGGPATGTHAVMDFALHPLRFDVGITLAVSISPKDYQTAVAGGYINVQRDA